MASVEEIAFELYGLPPEGFTAARDERATQARDDGDRDAAAAIKALRKPTRSAHLANRLVRDESPAVTELTELGAALRDAQARLDGDELRRLTTERRRLVAGLVRRTREQSERPVSEATSRELESLLVAAVASAEASAELTAGCLSTGLTAGSDPWSGGAEVIPLRARRTGAAPPGRSTAAAKTQRHPASDDAAPQRRALAAARTAHDEAQKAAEEAEAAVAEATAARSAARRRVTELTDELHRAEQDRTAAEREIRVAGRRRDSARAAADRARRRLDRAEAAQP